MRLEIITAERKVYDDDVELVVVPGSDGELGILSKHAPLMSTLQPGELLIRKEGEDTYLAVSGGFIEVLDDRSSFQKVVRIRIKPNLGALMYVFIVMGGQDGLD